MGRKTKRDSTKIFCFPTQKIFFLEISPGHERCSFENLLELFWKEVEDFGSKSGTDEKILFPTKLICGHINCSFEKCREPFNESPETFRPNSQNDQHMCGYFRKKIPAKKYSAYVESTFNNFPIKFRTKISKLSAQTFQQNFSLDSLMQY